MLKGILEIIQGLVKASFVDHFGNGVFSTGIVNPSTPVILHSTPAMTTKTTVTDTTKIIPTRTSFYTWGTSSKVSGKIIPTKTTTYTSSTSSKVSEIPSTTPQPPEKQVISLASFFFCVCTVISVRVQRRLVYTQPTIKLNRRFMVDVYYLFHSFHTFDS